MAGREEGREGDKQQNDTVASVDIHAVQFAVPAAMKWQQHVLLRQMPTMNPTGCRGSAFWKLNQNGLEVGGYDFSQIDIIQLSYCIHN